VQEESAAQHAADMKALNASLETKENKITEMLVRASLCGRVDVWLCERARH